MNNGYTYKRIKKEFDDIKKIEEENSSVVWLVDNLIMSNWKGKIKGPVILII